ncbi:hypothetical protein AB0J83_12065 [Actinoplanes sp. NPDC049596]|uniref:hypothetical protein n=1 Tax=unclassified Actinoplanes TaxID=2626549 RepID=UPI003433A486
MDFAALVLSVEETRRTSHSALPGAAVRRPGERRGRVRSVMRRVFRRAGPDDR